MDWPTFARRSEPLGYEDKADPTLAVRVLTCPGCGDLVRVWLNGRPTSTLAGAAHRRRQVEIPTGPRAGRKDVCNGVCLNGKHSCSCRCPGKCHGAGSCQCAAPVGARS
jgi:hypothetical protein